MKKITLIIVFLSNIICFGQQWNQLGIDIDGENERDSSGRYVSLSSDGNILAIGSSNNDDNGSNTGHVRVFSYNDINGWLQLGNDIDGFDDHAGSSRCALSGTGTRIVIGAPGAGNIPFNASGYTRVFEYNGSTWVQLGETIFGEADFDNSGSSIDFSNDGNVIAIGAYNNDGKATDAGHVRIYKYNGNSWIQQGNDIDGEAAGDNSGWSISLSNDGNSIAIGAIFNDGTGNNAGHVRVFSYNGNSWNQIGEDIDGEAEGDNSGFSVDLSGNGNIVAIGANRNSGIADNAGHVRVYEYNGSSWIQLGLDIDGEAEGDLSGNSLSLSNNGNTVAIGAIFNDGNGDNAGHVRVYEYNGSSWIQLGLDIDGEAEGDSSGNSLSLSNNGNTVAIGATRNNGPGIFYGHTRIYKYTTTTLSSSDTIITNLTYNVLNGNLKTNLDNIQIDINDISGRKIKNKNLKGFYIVRFTNMKGEIQVDKILIK